VISLAVAVRIVNPVLNSMSYIIVPWDVAVVVIRPITVPDAVRLSNKVMAPAAGVLIVIECNVPAPALTRVVVAELTFLNEFVTCE
jgi:hypothetical protein